MNPLTKFMTISLVAIALLIAGALMDGPGEIETAQAVADEAEYAAALADGGQAQCAAFGGAPKWTTHGDLICRAPKVEKPTTLAAGAR